jgi:hypothetical protein
MLQGSNSAWSAAIPQRVGERRFRKAATAGMTAMEPESNGRCRTVLRSFPIDGRTGWGHSLHRRRIHDLDHARISGELASEDAEAIAESLRSLTRAVVVDWAHPSATCATSPRPGPSVAQRQDFRTVLGVSPGPVPATVHGSGARVRVTRAAPSVLWVALYAATSPAPRRRRRHRRWTVPGIPSRRRWPHRASRP